MEFKDKGGRKEKEGRKGERRNTNLAYSDSLISSLYRPIFLGYVALKFHAACDKPKPRTGQWLPYLAPIR